MNSIQEPSETGIDELSKTDMECEKIIFKVEK